MQVESIHESIQSASVAPLRNVIETAKDPNEFGNLVTQGLSKVNEQLLQSDADLKTLASGDVQNLHQIMIRLEESRLSFQLMLQVRNRLLESYQDIMKMQI